MAGCIEEIRDRMAIQDVILKYARAIDREGLERGAGRLP